MLLQSETRKKTYTPARLSKLTPEQANLILIGHASCGDQGAKDLLDVVYPPSESEPNHRVRANCEDREPAQIQLGTFRLIRRAWQALTFIREDVRRFVRG